MRESFWRILAHAAAANGGAPWVFLPPDATPTLSNAAFLGPKANVSLVTMGRGVHRRKGNGMARECEAFLAGRYFELFPKGTRRVLPGWVWINPLAHCGRTQLKQVAELSFSSHDPLALLSYLADEVLLSARDDFALEAIQRFTLVPLESGLMQRACRPNGRELAGIVQDALEQPIRRP